MKAKRRHELQTNALADWLGKHIESGAQIGQKITGPVKPYSKAVAGVAIALVVLGVVVLVATGTFGRLYSSLLGRGAAPAWTDYFAAFDKRDGEALAAVAQRYGDEEAAFWAAQSAGDIELAQGASLIYRQREDAQQALNRAKRYYDQALEAKHRYPLLYYRALLGAAQTHECLSVAGRPEDFKENLDKAQQCYTEVANDASNSELAEMARRRLRDLESLRKSDFYIWLAENQPTPPPSSVPPQDLQSLPDRSDLTIPGLTGQSDTPSDSAEAPPTEEAGGEQPDDANQPVTLPPSAAGPDRTSPGDEAPADTDAGPIDEGESAGDTPPAGVSLQPPANRDEGAPE